ncbi:MAG TPA: alpha/beta fold hydrolase [Candidatus Udaeobacter sp.]|nr:alpha/beta fold hydrolase [Candidatus Udaeobacter sp.]
MDAIPLVLIPGLLCTGELWAPQIAGLSDLARITVADHGVADDMAGIARAILAAAPARFALAGLSMGGAIALAIMRQAPERVLKLALLDTTAAPDSEDIRNSRLFYIDLARSGRFDEITRDHLLKRLIHPDRLADGPLIEVILRMARDTGVEAFIRQERAILHRPDSRSGLGAIRCPTLVIVGDRDVITPLERAREIAGAIPNSRLEIIAACGHLSTLERPGAVTDCLRAWLAG